MKKLKKQDVAKVLELLKDTYPDAGCALDFGSNYQLLTAVALSAQTTDKKVNQVTEGLFQLCPTAAEMAEFDEEELPRLEKTRRHTIEAVVDRLITGKLDRSRLTDSVETALRHGGGTIHVLLEAPAGEKPDFEEEKFSENLACPDCGVSYGELLPRN